MKKIRVHKVRYCYALSVEVPLPTYSTVCYTDSMKTNIKFTNTDRDEKLKEYALEKVGAFSKLIHEKALEGAVCDVEFRKATHHQKGDVCYAEATLKVDGKVYRASKEELTLKKAIDKVKDDILRELRIDKRAGRSERVRGAGELKKRLRGE